VVHRKHVTTLQLAQGYPSSVDVEPRSIEQSTERRRRDFPW
jgi:hypothetical protein